MEKISQCRLCKCKDLTLILNLGLQALTGAFHKITDPKPLKTPLELYKCANCHLIQIGHTLAPEQFYGDNYGYRSGLNKTMMTHLKAISDKLIKYLPPNALIVDIGSNDGTLLSFFPKEHSLLGIDPLADRFKNFYPPHVERKSAFFCKELLDGRKASLITSVSMLYDLEDPIHFAEQIHDSLTDDGVWFFEQSYLPTMLSQLSYDTVCHEHLEYYALRQIKQIAEAADLKLIHVEFSDCNGGSIAVLAAKKESWYPDSINQIYVLQKENERLLNTLTPYEAFQRKVLSHKIELTNLLFDLKEKKQRVFGYGASTKGNVLLQYCGVTPELLPVIAEVNADKIGSFTPGSNILIIDENTAHAMKPDYFLVLPWHFKKGIIERERHFLTLGGRLIFPLPTVPTLVQS